MTQDILKTLEDKGIQVPEHHKQPLLAQWEALQQLKSNPDLVKITSDDIGLTHVPGGGQE